MCFSILVLQAREGTPVVRLCYFVSVLGNTTCFQQVGTKQIRLYNAKGEIQKFPNYMRSIYEGRIAFIENKYEFKKENGILNC
jgi:hypothetical protein